MKLQKLLDTFSRNNYLSYFMRIFLVGAKLFYADRQTDRHNDA